MPPNLRKEFNLDLGATHLLADVSTQAFPMASYAVGGAWNAIHNIYMQKILHMIERDIKLYPFDIYNAYLLKNRVWMILPHYAELFWIP